MSETTRSVQRIVAVAILIAALPRLSYAAACKGDKRLDVPMQFNVTALSPGRIHLSAFGGSDKSGWVDIGALGSGAWTVYDNTGKQLDFFLPSPLVFAATEMLKETNLEGLIPGGSYTIQLASMDGCGNMGYVRKPITMPGATSETNRPVVSTPDLVRTGSMGSATTVLHFSATDNTGIKHISILFNGNLIREYKYFTDEAFRWWVDTYDADASVSTLEGPNFYVSYPDAYRGQYGVVSVIVEDYFGNQYTATAELGL
jgi:hypothetical protein